MITLTDTETRVLGALVEKAITTPEYYPLTLNALVNACNQKSNREPIVEYDGRTVGEAIEGLKAKSLVSIVMGGESRVPKYRQYFGEAYELSPPEVAIINVLMLRGPQTVAELRTRAERLYPFASGDDVQVVLESLIARSEPLVMKLPRQAGQKEARYAHLLAGEPTIPESSAEPVETRADRLQRLEEEVAALRQELLAFKDEFASFRKQFE